MIMLMEKEKEKPPSKRLKEKIHACIASFQKLGMAVNEALEKGREEGFTDKEIGKMIRKEMLRAGFDRSTVAGYLPSTAKQKPRGKPGIKISRKYLQTVDYPMLEQEHIQESDILAKDDFEEQKKKLDVENHRPASDAHVVDVQPVTPLETIIGSAYVEPDPEGYEYDIEHLENYSRSSLERIIKWQHKYLQECHNEATSWKSKYMGLKTSQQEGYR